MFIVGPAVVGADFIGRKVEISKLKSWINEGWNISIHGLPRIGKTSIVKETIRQMKEENPDSAPVFFEFSLTRQAEDVKSFNSQLLRMLKRELNKAGIIEILEDYNMNEYSASIPYRNIIEIYSEIYSITKRKLYIVIDEMDYAHVSLRGQIQTLRELGNLTSYIRLMSISRHTLTQIFPIGSDGSNLPGIFSRDMPVQGYVDDDVLLFREQLENEMASSLSEEEWKQIKHYCGNAPILLAYFASKILEKKEEYPNINFESLISASSPYGMCLYYWFQTLCDRKLIKALRDYLALGTISSSELKMLGFVSDRGITIPYFREYVESKYDEDSDGLIGYYFSLINDTDTLIERASVIARTLQGNDTFMYKKLQNIILNMKMILLKCNYAKESHTLYLQLDENSKQNAIIKMDVSTDEINKISQYYNSVILELDTMS